MIQSIQIEALPPDQQIESLRHHVLMFTGYALFMAAKMGLSPDEAATLFMQPLLISTRVVSLEDQAKGDALRISMIHGSENVSLHREDLGWLIQIRIGDDKSILEQWGAPVSFWAAWLDQQSQLISKAKGIKYVIWLESDILNIQLGTM